MSFWIVLGITTLALMLGGGLCYWIGKMITGINPNFKYWYKYTLFKKKYREEDVRWSMKAIKDDLNDEDIMRLLLTTGTPINEAKEKLYIFQETKKNYKGGMKNE